MRLTDTRASHSASRRLSCVQASRIASFDIVLPSHGMKRDRPVVGRGTIGQQVLTSAGQAADSCNSNDWLHRLRLRQVIRPPGRRQTTPSRPRSQPSAAHGKVAMVLSLRISSWRHFSPDYFLAPISGRSIARRLQAESCSPALDSLHGRGLLTTGGPVCPTGAV